MSKKNLMYILGAGSSKDFGFPLGHEIFAHADKVLSSVENPDIKIKLEASINVVDQIMAQICSNLPEDKTEYPLFEEILTFIWQSRKDSNDKKGE